MFTKNSEKFLHEILFRGRRESGLGKYFSMIIISNQHNEEKANEDLRDEKNEKSENEFSSIDSLGITNLFTELLFSLHRFEFAFWVDLQSISLRDYHLMSSLMSISIKFFSFHKKAFLAFNVHFFECEAKKFADGISWWCLFIMFNELQKRNSADFYFIFESHFSLSAALFPFREFPWALNSNMITSTRHDLG